MKPHAWLIDFSRVGFLLWMLAPISLASAQEVRNPCNPVAPMRVAPMPVYVPEVAPREVYEPQIAEAQIAEITIAQPEIFKPDLCPNPSPIGIRHIPAITAKIRSEYETSLYTAKGIDAR